MDSSRRISIALAEDAQTKDMSVCGVRAEDSTQAHQLIEQFSLKQDWEPPVDGQVHSFRINAAEPILDVGHAFSDYQKLRE